MNCKICELHKIQPQAIIQSTEFWIIRNTSSALLPGYCILEPRRHVTTWSDLTSKEIIEMGTLIQEIESRLKFEHHAEKVYVVTISEVVSHLHLHLIPRATGMQLRGLHLIEKAITSN
ncbi:HIT family protein [Paenibacillus rigui]|uniref:Diadenosine tetraphosphate hydrolase n=1 Tax=Paenibacillus rigui TaxID=554312 RepID=A0A229UY87_9BACL|nr:HIT domain-containing protein [Paenibacillus rigui]OXM88408.1 diadenosine tetraphosphate hydrolase [Paenibacillus rigui]